MARGAGRDSDELELERGDLRSPWPTLRPRPALESSSTSCIRVLVSFLPGASLAPAAADETTTQHHRVSSSPTPTRPKSPASAGADYRDRPDSVSESGSRILRNAPLTASRSAFIRPEEERDRERDRNRSAAVNRVATERAEPRASGEGGGRLAVSGTPRSQREREATGLEAFENTTPTSRAAIGVNERFHRRAAIAIVIEIGIGTATTSPRSLVEREPIAPLAEALVNRAGPRLRRQRTTRMFGDVAIHDRYEDITR